MSTIDLNNIHICIQCVENYPPIFQLTDVTRGYDIPKFCYGGIKRMYDDDGMRPVLRNIGFYRRSVEENITWTQPEGTAANYITPLLHVLQGLYRTPSGVQASMG